jgi:anaerobic carbon-monoxide dehydrogenase iron sulfur subunit
MKMLQIDIERCLGCHSCELACAVEHSQSKKLSLAINESPPPGYRVNVITGDGVVGPLQCRHCEDAPCVIVCPSGALVKSDDGPVLLKHELCVGCRLCLIACPFGVIYADAEGKAVIKCDLCRERLMAGEDPACVSACPTKALRFCEPENVK